MEKRIFLLLCFFLTNLYSQSVSKIGYSVPSTFIPQGFVLHSINAGGFSKLFNLQVSEAGCINPAAISRYPDLSFGLSYQIETDVRPAWIAKIDHSRNHLAKPQSAALVIGDGDIHYALSYYQLYNSTALFDPIPVTTVSQPEGTGETFTPVFYENIDIYSLVLSWRFAEGDREVSIGARLGLGVLDYHQGILKAESYLDGLALTGALGFTWQLDKNIKLGVSYDWGPKFDEKLKPSTNFSYDLDTSRVSNVLIAKYDYYLKSKKPDILSLAMSIKWNNTFSSTLDLNYIFWKQLQENALNNLDISSGVIINVQQDMTVSFAFLLTDRDFSAETDTAFGTNSKLNGLFLSTGIKQKFGLLGLNLSVTSSYLTSGSWREQLIAKAGLDLYL